MAENAIMQEQRVYQLRLAGRLDEEFVAAYCPAGTVLSEEEQATVLADICTDQSGFVGLIRHLHNLGITILTMDSYRRRQP